MVIEEIHLFVAVLRR